MVACVALKSPLVGAGKMLSNQGDVTFTGNYEYFSTQNLSYWDPADPHKIWQSDLSTKVIWKMAAAGRGFSEMALLCADVPRLPSRT